MQLLSVYVVCCLLLKWANIWLLTSTCLDGPQPKLGQRCNTGTFICWWGQRSNIKVKGHLRSSCQNVNYNVFEKLKPDWNQTWFMDTIWDPLYVHVIKGHIPRSKVIRGDWGVSPSWQKFGPPPHSALVPIFWPEPVPLHLTVVPENCLQFQYIFVLTFEYF